MKLSSFWRLFPLAFLALAGAALTTLAQSSPETPKEASPKEQAEALETTDIPQYPDTAAGLEDLIEEMMRLQESRDSKTLQIYAKSLELPNADAWFEAAFGANWGPEMAQATSPYRDRTERDAIAMIESMRKEGLTGVTAAKFTASCNFDATPDEYPILLLRQNQETFYDVRFNSTTGESIWGFFVYADGGFRYIANAPRKALEDARRNEVEATRQPLRVAAGVQSAKLVRQIPPVYPPDARARGLQGDVLLRAVVAQDGSVRDVTLLEGVCGLSEAAMDAVRQWRYSPTVLDGALVEVETTVTVNFSLATPR
ncbi:MAG TPA: energy transducer TonB [Verrucomicrobiae bacterium]|nr:energy transducer TonB [Verrucomicrobiae bacterium]